MLNRKQYTRMSIQQLGAREMKRHIKIGNESVVCDMRASRRETMRSTHTSELDLKRRFNLRLRGVQVPIKLRFCASTWQGHHFN